MVNMKKKTINKRYEDKIKVLALKKLYNCVLICLDTLEEMEIQNEEKARTESEIFLLLNRKF